MERVSYYFSLQVDATSMTVRALERLKDLYCDIAQVAFLSLFQVFLHHINF